MAVTYVTNNTYFNTTPATSGSFTPGGAGNAITVLCQDQAAGRSISVTGTGTYITNIASAPSDDGLTWGIATNLACAAGAQTVTATGGTGGDSMLFFTLEFSGANSIQTLATPYVSRVAPGTGAGGILGQSQLVATGDILVAVVYNTNGSTAATPVGGSLITSNGLTVVQRYAGAGSNITPSATAGGTDGGSDFFVMQWVESASSSGNGSASVAWWRA